MMLSRRKLESCGAGYRSVTHQKCELSPLKLGWETGIESSPKRYLNDLQRGNMALDAVTYLWLAREWHGKEG